MTDTMEKRVRRLEAHLRGLGINVLTPEQAEEEEKENARLEKEAAKAAKEAEAA